MSTNPITTSSSILGYRVLERIGSGGYGEVWRVEAPGGIHKALKVLYGAHDGRGAQLELKSLDKIKQLRHPFLLSLERIEVNENQLIVISELADHSLADLFNSYVEQGLPGIPREELLNYLSQAAEALDFIASEHQLQHLDVKPENLLVIGNHAKIADFGLVKRIQDSTQSLLGGLTPAYAAPELFDGRPSTHSDQYSLAMVFQEMLCGERCFQGNTPAQLAVQHMYERPNLSQLCKKDQKVVGRALSKNPDLRFKSCRAFIQELIQRKTVAREIRGFTKPACESFSECNSQTFILRSEQTPNHTRSVSLSQLQGVFKETVILDAPPVDAVPTETRPTLFVALGKSATQVCQRLRQKMVGSHPDPYSIPAFKILCFDTDHTAISQATNGTSTDSLQSAEGIALPLGRAEDYREKPKVHAGWLNRRWLYNIPKSGQIECLRPLGRLAFVDNFSRVWDSLEGTLDAMLDPDAISQTMEQLNQSISPSKARVFIVTSISGGIGSGTVLDMAYTIRLALRENGCESGEVIGVLMHSCNSRERESAIATANAYAFLTELKQYVEHGFPGDDSCGLPEINDELPFDHSYVLCLGDNLPPEEWSRRLDSVAEYLYLNTFGTAPRFFDACRELNQDGEQFEFRSFGVANEGLKSQSFVKVAQLLQRQVVESWLKRIPESSDFMDRQIASQEWMDEKAVVREIETAMDAMISGESLVSATNRFQDALMGQGFTDEADAQMLQCFLGANTEKQSQDFRANHACSEQAVQVYESLGRQRKCWSSQIEGMMLSGLNVATLSFPLIQACIQRIDDALKALQKSVKNRLLEIRGSLSEMRNEMQNPQHKKGRRSSNVAQQYARGLKELLFNEVLHQVYRSLQLNSSVTRERLGRLKMVVQGQLSTLASPAEIYEQFETLNAMERKILDHVLEREDNIVETIALRHYEESIRPTGSFERVMLADDLHIASLFHDVFVASCQSLGEFGEEIDVDEIIRQWRTSDEQEAAAAIEQAIQVAQPLVWDCGGKARVMIAYPSKVATCGLKQTLADLLGHVVHAEKQTRGELSIVMECERLEFADFVYRLIQQRADCPDLAQRIMTRNDVKWHPIRMMV